jgi:hypothetical protein
MADLAKKQKKSYWRCDAKLARVPFVNRFTLNQAFPSRRDTRLSIQLSRHFINFVITRDTESFLDLAVDSLGKFTS